MPSPNETHLVRCDFTEGELKDFSQALAREISGLARSEEEKKVAASQFAERIEAHKAVSAQLARNINMGYEMRLIECSVELDKPTTGLATIIRLDTGEIVKERLMTFEEKQMALPLEKGAKV